MLDTSRERGSHITDPLNLTLLNNIKNVWIGRERKIKKFSSDWPFKPEVVCWKKRVGGELRELVARQETEI